MFSSRRCRNQNETFIDRVLIASHCTYVHDISNRLSHKCIKRTESVCVCIHLFCTLFDKVQSVRCMLCTAQCIYGYCFCERNKNWSWTTPTSFIFRWFFFPCIPNSPFHNYIGAWRNVVSLVDWYAIILKVVFFCKETLSMGCEDDLETLNVPLTRCWLKMFFFSLYYWLSACRRD